MKIYKFNIKIKSMKIKIRNKFFMKYYLIILNLKKELIIK